MLCSNQDHPSTENFYTWATPHRLRPCSVRFAHCPARFRAIAPAGYLTELPRSRHFSFPDRPNHSGSLRGVAPVRVAVSIRSGRAWFGSSWWGGSGLPFLLAPNWITHGKCPHTVSAKYGINCRCSPPGRTLYPAMVYDRPLVIDSSSARQQDERSSDR
jgi:hypothetical protein